MTLYDMTIGGESLRERTGAVAAGWTERPPEPVTRWLDVPGRRDGPLDVSEVATGSPEYGRRRLEVELLRIVPGGRPQSTGWLTELRRWLHNRRFRFEVQWDPGYTYEGRFSVEENAAHDGIAEAKLGIECSPWKTRGERTYRVEASGGKTVLLRLGAPVVPKVTCEHPCLVNYRGRTFAFEPGTSTDPDLVLRGPEAVLTVNATPENGTATWAGYAGAAWGDFDGLTVAYLMSAGKPEAKSKPWTSPPFDGAWEAVSGTWLENAFEVDSTPPKRDVFFTYEWKDL